MSRNKYAKVLRERQNAISELVAAWKGTDGETREKLRQGAKKLLEVYGEKVTGDEG